MAFKKWFRGGAADAAATELTIDDLVVLERYGEAEDRLRAKLKVNPNDLHSHLKLGDVYIRMRKLDQAVDEYVFVAEEYADDGFFDKGIALLSKVMKLVPTDDTLPLKIEKLQQEKRLEHSRMLAIEALLQGSPGEGRRDGTSALEIERLWSNLSRTRLVQGLDGEQIKRLFAAMTLARWPRGTTFAERGADDERLVLVAEGELEAIVELRKGRPTVLRTFGPGDLIGDRSLLERRPWPVTLRSTIPVTALLLDREGLERALAGNPDPRTLIEALREQQNDRSLEQSVTRLGLG